jgi:transposase
VSVVRDPARRVCFRQPPLSPAAADALAGDAVGPAHVARIILAVLQTLDLSALLLCYSGRGCAPFCPLPLLAAVVYEIHLGHRSPADWLRHSRESIPTRWLLRGLSPSRTAWYDFRDRLPEAVLTLTRQAVRAALDEGLTPACRAAVDGTLVAADSTRHHLLSQEALERRRRQIDDADGLFGPPAPAPGFVAETPAGRARQREHYSKLQQQMRLRQEANAAKRSSKRKPAGKVLISPGDPEAPLGLDKLRVYRPLYNVQLAADVDSPLILAHAVAAQVSDSGLLGGVLEEARRSLGRGLSQVVADAGYAGGADLAAAERAGVVVYAPWQANDYSQTKEARTYPKERFEYRPAEDVYVCPAGKTLACAETRQEQRSGVKRIELKLYRAQAATCGACPKRAGCTTAKQGRSVSRSEHEEHIEQLRERMKTPEAKALYRLRKQTVERINADLKHHRDLDRVSGRGLKRARVQVGLLILSHNLIALHKLRHDAADAGQPAPPRL